MMRSQNAPKVGEPGAASQEAYEARRSAFIEEEVDRGLRIYDGLFPPEVLAAFRERTLLYLTTDPEMVRAIDVAVPRPDAGASEAIRKSESEP